MCILGGRTCKVQYSVRMKLVLYEQVHTHTYPKTFLSTKIVVCKGASWRLDAPFQRLDAPLLSVNITFSIDHFSLSVNIAIKRYVPPLICAT